MRQRFRAHPDTEADFVLKQRVCNLERALHAKNVKSNVLPLRSSFRALEKFERENDSVFGMSDDILAKRCSDDLVDGYLQLHTETVDCIASTRRLDAQQMERSLAESLSLPK